MIARWVELWNRRESAVSLACVRVLVAAVLLVDLLSAWALGALPELWAPPPSGIGWAALTEQPPFVVRCFGASSALAMACWLLAVVSAVGVLLGAWFRLSAWLLVFAMLELHGFLPDCDAIDDLLRVALPLLALSDAAAVFSLDAYRKGRDATEAPQVFAFPRYLIMLQLLWVYFSAAHHRGKASWRLEGGFSAIADVLGDPHFARFAPGSFASLYPLTQLGSLLTMAFEFGAPLFLLFTYYERRRGRGGRLGEWIVRLRLRNVWLLLGVALHLGIAASMELGIFPFGILALYPALVHPDELSAWLRKLGRLRSALSL